MSDSARILLVEDDPEQAALFAQVLSMSGHDVTVAASAEEAQAQLAAAPFALLLADWDLPGMPGDELIRRMKPAHPALKTVLYSNHTHVEEAATAAHADAWFFKIQGIVELRRVVKRLLAE